MQNSSDEILGVSHLALGTRTPDIAAQYLAGLGYREFGRIDAAENPVPKVDVVDRPLSPQCAVRILTAQGAFPTLELLTELDDPDSYETPASRFAAGINCDGIRTAMEQAAAWRGGVHPADAFFATDGDGNMGATDRTFLLAVRCPGNPAPVAKFWKTLGLSPIQDDGYWRVEIRKRMVGSNLTMVATETSSGGEAAAINRSGFVCLSLFCRNADRLRDSLANAGYWTGPCFDFRPLGRPYRIFFARSPLGEIYEFMSASVATAKELKG
jgi:hypothetical protein